MEPSIKKQRVDEEGNSRELKEDDENEENIKF